MNIVLIFREYSFNIIISHYIYFYIFLKVFIILSVIKILQVKFTLDVGVLSISNGLFDKV